MIRAHVLRVGLPLLLGAVVCRYSVRDVGFVDLDGLRFEVRDTSCPITRCRRSLTRSS